MCQPEVSLEDVQLYENHVHWSVGSYHLSVCICTWSYQGSSVVSLQTVPMTTHFIPAPPLSWSLVLPSTCKWHYDGSWGCYSGLCSTLGCSQTAKMFQPTLDKIENRQYDEGKLILYFSWPYADDLYYIVGHRAKRAKVDMHLANTALVPDWLPKEHEIWLEANNYVTQLNPTPASHHLFASYPLLFICFGVAKKRTRGLIFIIFSSLQNQKLGLGCTETPTPHCPRMEVNSGPHILKATLAQTWWEHFLTGEWVLMTPMHSGSMVALSFLVELSAKIAAGQHTLLPGSFEVLEEPKKYFKFNIIIINSII